MGLLKRKEQKVGYQGLVEGMVMRDFVAVDLSFEGSSDFQVIRQSFLKRESFCLENFIERYQVIKEVKEFKGRNLEFDFSYFIIQNQVKKDQEESILVINLSYLITLNQVLKVFKECLLVINFDYFEIQSFFKKDFEILLINFDYYFRGNSFH